VYRKKIRQNQKRKMMRKSGREREEVCRKKIRQNQNRKKVRKRGEIEERCIERR